jgi:hypothetical protein
VIVDLMLDYPFGNAEVRRYLGRFGFTDPLA